MGGLCLTLWHSGGGCVCVCVCGGGGGWSSVPYKYGSEIPCVVGYGYFLEPHNKIKSF